MSSLAEQAAYDKLRRERDALADALDTAYETFGIHKGGSPIVEMAAVIEYCGELIGKGVYAEPEPAS